MCNVWRAYNEHFPKMRQSALPPQTVRPLPPPSSIPRTSEWISVKSDIAEVHKMLSSYNSLVNWYYLHAHLRAFRTKGAKYVFGREKTYLERKFQSKINCCVHDMPNACKCFGIIDWNFANVPELLRYLCIFLSCEGIFRIGWLNFGYKYFMWAFCCIRC
jgi:hypothetical protein